MRVLICYDGSADAQAAIDRAGVLMPGSEATVLVIWETILQTMTRSVNTLATVVITLVALLAFGGASLQNFAFALLVGICSGGYHSIFYSAPLVYILREREQKKAAKLRAQQRAAGTLEKPRTVAEARAQAASGLSREQILAARKERRSREKQAPVRSSGGPARYKRKRPAAQTPAEAAAAESAGIQYDDEEQEFEQIDPLDAQNAGMHEHELTLGHEEIHLNLEDDVEASAEHGTIEGESPATAKRE